MDKKLDIIYLFGYSLRTQTHLKRLIPIIKSQVSKGSIVGVVLIHDGVIGTSVKGEIPSEIRALTVSNGLLNLYVMVPDLEARGLSKDGLLENIKPIEYDDLVDLLEQSTKIISWM